MENTSSKYWVPAFCAGAVLTAGLLFNATLGSAQSPATPGDFDPALVERGIAISPVSLNLTGKDRNKVGYGSYLVNAIGGCNDCHTNPNWAEGGDPFFGQPLQVNTEGYLAGGVAFGPFLSRNITPDATGAPGALSRSDFMQVLKTGQDFKQLHPEIAPILQVMPWPIHQNLFDRDMDAIYEFLSAIPCLEGGPGTVADRCQAAPQTEAVASPKEGATVARQAGLDGTASTSADGKALSYRWSIPAGFPQAAIQRGLTATPTVQFGTTKGQYVFELTVTDSQGNVSTDRATINFGGF